MKIVAGSTQPNLAKRIGELLNPDLVQSRVEKFKDGELRVKIIGNLENEDVCGDNSPLQIQLTII